MFYTKNRILAKKVLIINLKMFMNKIMRFFEKKWVMIVCLCMISVLHGIIFATAQDANRFFSQIVDGVLAPYGGLLSFSLYFSGIAVALLNQTFCSYWGIKKVLILGLVASLIGIALFLLTNLLPFGSGLIYIFAFIGMLLVGAAIASVATILTTYVVVEFPKFVAVGLILLYSCLNFGVQMSDPFFEYFSKAGIETGYLIGLALIMMFFIIVIRRYFVPSDTPSNFNVAHITSQIWKVLNYRFLFFIVVMILYGMNESLFSVLGYHYLEETLSPEAAEQAVFFFWLALNLGQVGIGLPAFWILPSKVLKILPFFIITALILIPFQSLTSEFALAFTIGGLGCSAFFPLLIAMIILDIRALDINKSNHDSMISYLQVACGYMIASYIFGLGMIAFQMEIMDQFPNVNLIVNFKIGIALAAVMLGLVFYLARTSSQKEA